MVTIRSLAAVACAITAMGCARQSPSATPTPSSPPSSATASASTTAEPATSKPLSTRCHTADLSLALQDAGAAAGTSYKWVVLTNSSGPTCTLFGYPGVSLVDASGALLGKPAERNPVHAPQVVTLHPGESGYATVGFPNAGNFSPGTCTAESASMRVYPPDELRSLLTTVHEAYCPGFSVSVITATKQ